MSLSSGTKFAHLEILESIGKGGMGEVYRARDTKLDREVAVKVLPEELAGDADRVARFEREAKLLASLNHPNIASIYGLEESDGLTALVLELVEGPTLAERIQEGPIPVDESIAVARQIAEALEAGHEAGVIHRDLKPANVKLKEDGTVKVLDYGLAKAFAGDATGGADRELSQSPTLTRQGTQVGVILGTAAYMSPEQARGKPVDKRADIWAFGVVLFEMLTGKRLFEGETVSDTLASVLKTDPDWGGLPDDTPWLLKRFLKRCLEKNPHARLHDAADARLELRDIREVPGNDSLPSAPRTRITVMIAALALVTLIIGLAIGGVVVSRLGAPEVQTPVRFGVEVTNLVPGGRQLTLSPDGRTLVFAVRRPNMLFRRDLMTLDIESIPGTEGGRSPFFSPDGRSLGFRAGNELRKVPSAGGPSQLICECRSLGADWGDDDTIIIGSDNGLQQVSARGGDPRPLDDVLTGRARDPELLPSGRGVLFTDHSQGSKVAVYSLVTGERKVLTEGVGPRYLPSGHILFARGSGRAGALLAVPFDAEQLDLTGDAVATGEEVSIPSQGAASFDLSRNGTLVHLVPDATRTRRLVWVDRAGRQSLVTEEERRFSHPRLSEDGRRLALSIGDEDAISIWVYDLDRGTRTRLTTEGMAFDPAWTADGAGVTYAHAGEDFDLYTMRADGTGEAVVNVSKPGNEFQPTWSADGETLLFQHQGDIWALAGSGEPSPVIDSPAIETRHRLSPDGRYLAYTSDESGERDVYVVSFPETAQRWTISTAGGDQPVWSRDGRELFYRVDDKMMVVDVTTAPEFSASTPRELFRGSFYWGFNIQYDVSPEGDRFVMIEGESTAEIRVTLHFDEELRQRLP